MIFRGILLVTLFSIFCNQTTAQQLRPVQLTQEAIGHTLNSTQCFSADDNWVVFDTRNDDTKIGSTPAIGILNLHTNEVKILYNNPHTTEYGPGVGAATFSPKENRVMFIQGITNANKHKPYGATRRTGVSILLQHPDSIIYMDARNIYPPFTSGALRGGTHAHSWSGDASLISFTYNDYIMEQLGKDMRTVGVMFPKPVKVPEDAAGENNNGQMFAVVVTRVTNNPLPGSDEIDKAFDECWIGTNGYKKQNGNWQKKAIAFQGNVKDKSGKTKTEVFVADLPDKLDIPAPGSPLQGTSQQAPGVPANVVQRRITYTANGIEGPRHWLRSTPDGKLITFLAKDHKGIINAFGVPVNGGKVSQLSYLPSDIQGGINFSPDGKYLVYFAGNAICITDINTRQSYKLYEDVEPYGAISWSHNGKWLVYNQYVQHAEGGRWLQIFAIQLDKHLTTYLHQHKI